MSINNKTTRGEKTPYIGVHKHGSKYRVRVYVNGKRRQITGFLSDTEAAKAYDTAVRASANNKRRKLNFPTEAELLFQNAISSTSNATSRVYNGRSCSSSFQGIHYDKNSKKWRATVSLNGKQTRLGYFSTDVIAAKTYDYVTKIWYSDGSSNGKLNFPLEMENRNLVLPEVPPEKVLLITERVHRIMNKRREAIAYAAANGVEPSTKKRKSAKEKAMKQPMKIDTTATDLLNRPGNINLNYGLLAAGEGLSGQYDNSGGTMMGGGRVVVPVAVPVPMQFNPELAPPIPNPTLMNAGDINLNV